MGHMTMNFLGGGLLHHVWGTTESHGGVLESSFDSFEGG